MNSRKSSLSVFMLKAIELILSVMVVLLSYFIPLHIFDYNITNFSSFNFLASFIAITALLIFLVAEYTNGEKTSKSRNILKVLLCSFTLAVVITSLAFFLRGFAFPRSIIILGFIIQITILSLLRIYFRSLMRRTIYNKVLVIGQNNEQDWLFNKAVSSKLPNEIIHGYLSIDVVGLKLADIIKSYTKVFVSDKALKLLDDNDLSLLSQCNVEMVIIPRKYEISVWGATLVPLGDSLAMSIKNFGLSYEAKVIKRIFDIIFSSIAIVLMAPIMFITAFAIYIEDKSSPFFIQERVTRNGKKFKLIKFRSMRIDAESQTGAIWASNSDDRITKIGRIIRPIWLDELPQFFNVLKGDMSIVGPRPERQELIDEFAKETPEFLYRTKVKAGITGYAQVLTSYATLPENKLKLDLVYIRRWSFVFDLLIIIETVRVIFMKIFSIFLSKKETIDSKVLNQVDDNYIEYTYR
ncbi:exopolysaccharide biosynthesis polyprenyl glycosylphosphotransferase family protein [Francisella philomiragia]|uniref:sugar transferase n=1 Tax=Francisella philomiragia TaxID=28110 RepID=UPI0005A56686|nr:sugar transferase [Francisella philomiragia]AJI57434.1 exopolysaccharide biosynthesis polyprenyl glycosylphosphotransferase family protein [Francisella philomiragia]